MRKHLKMSVKFLRSWFFNLMPIYHLRKIPRWAQRISPISVSLQYRNLCQQTFKRLPKRAVDFSSASRSHGPSDKIFQMLSTSFQQQLETINYPFLNSSSWVLIFYVNGRSSSRMKYASQNKVIHKAPFPSSL